MADVLAVGVHGVLEGSRLRLPGVPSPKSLGLRCVQNGPPARREEGAYLKRYVTDPAAAGQPPAHFQRNPLGRGRLAVFPRCSLLTYRSRYARRSRLEKQPTTAEDHAAIQ